CPDEPRCVRRAAPPSRTLLPRQLDSRSPGRRTRTGAYACHDSTVSLQYSFRVNNNDLIIRASADLLDDRVDRYLRMGSARGAIGLSARRENEQEGQERAGG